jgi:HEAT repeat protein
MGIFDRLFGKKKEVEKEETGIPLPSEKQQQNSDDRLKEPAPVSERRKAAPVDNVIARLSDVSDEERVGVAMELLKSSDYAGRAAVASEVARLEIKAVGVWYELANALADDYESVRLASAKAFWQLDGVGYAIRSLRDEHEVPAHMTRKQALEGIEVLLKTADDKSVFIALLRDNWQDYPQLDDLEKEYAEEVRENEQPDKERTTPICAKCHNSFTWEESYVTQETPGWSQFHTLGTGDNRPRLFCPKCGSLVVDWHITKDRDFDEWIWHGDNEAANHGVSLPPDPYSPGVGKGIPTELKPNFSAPVLDINKIKEWEKKEVEKEKAREERLKKPLNVQDLAAKEDVKSLIDTLREDHMSKTHKAAAEALAGIGAPAVEPLIAAFKSAERTEDSWADEDRHLRVGIVEALGNIGDPRTVETLLLALDDNIPFVRIDASYALERIGEAVIASESRNVRNREVIQALRRAAENDRDPRIYEKAKAILKVISGDDS